MGALGFGAVLRAVDLDDQSLAVADEIQDVATERCLAAEMVAIGAERAEIGPEKPLRWGGIAAQGAGAGDLLVHSGDVGRSPPWPSPRGGGERDGVNGSFGIVGFPARKDASHQQTMH